MTHLSYRIFYILNGAWRQRYVITIPILLLPILGLIIGTLAPKRYSAHTSLLVQETAKMNPFLEDLAVSAMVKERMAALETLLHRRHILTAVAEERGMITPQSSDRERDQTIDILSTALSVRMTGKDLIRIDYRAAKPEGMKETLEMVSKHFVEQLLAPERSSLTDSASFLKQHLKQRNNDLDQAETALADFKNENASEMPEHHANNIRRLNQLKQRLAERETELAGATRSLGGIDQQLSKTNPVVGRIEEQIIHIRSELALLKARYTDHHSKVQGTLRKLRRLEEHHQHLLSQKESGFASDQLWDIASIQISSNKLAQPLLVSQLNNLQLARSRVDALEQESTSLRQIITELEQQTTRFGAHEQTLRRLERDLRVKRELYEDLLHRYEMARVTGSLGTFEQEKRIKIIDRPFTPTTPANLPLILFVIAGLFGGIAVGSALAIIMEFADNTIRRRDQAEALSGVPVLSRIPLIPSHPEAIL